MVRSLSIIFALCLCILANHTVLAQANGDYRTRATGNWNNNNTWQVYNGGWNNCGAGDYPGAAGGTGAVEIRNNHIVTITADVPNSIASLTINGGNQNSYLQFNNGVRLYVTGQTYLNSNSDGDEKAIYVDGGNFTTGSIDANSAAGGANTRDAYIRISTGSCTVEGNISMNSSNIRTYILFTNSGSLFVEGTITGGNITDAAGGGAGAPTSGTVLYSGSAAQNIGSYTYFNLGLSGSGPFNFSSNVTIDGTFSSNGLVNTANDLTFNGSVACGGTMNASAGTVNYGAASGNIITGNYFNLTKSGGGTAVLCGNIDLSGTLSLNTGIIQLEDYDLVVLNTAAAAITGTFSATNMVETNGTGMLIKNGNSNAGIAIIYPVGSGGYYTQMQLSGVNAVFSGTGSIGVRAVSGFIGSGILQKHWDVITSGITSITATTAFTFNAAEVNGVQATYVPWYSPVTGTWQSPPNPTAAGANPFGSGSTTSLSGRWTAGTNQPSDPETYYSYQTGDWSSSSTWTSDPGGTTQMGTTIPGNGDIVIILNGRTVSLDGNIGSSDLKITINSGGIIDMSTYAFTSGLGELEGQGTLRLNSVNFPAASVNIFVNQGGGTTEYRNTSDINLPSQATYNHLVINTTPGITVTQINDIDINGNLEIKSGTYRINDNSSGAAATRNLTIFGNVTVYPGAFLSVGNGSTNTTTTPTGINGGTAPFLNYYEHFHRLVLYGNFTNNGTVRFTNLTYPVFNAFPPLGSIATSGAVSVYFMGSTDNTLYCNGITDFYNLILDKGSDQTFTLTVQPTSYSNFRLFGANISGGEGGGANPGLKKALWIRNGTLILKGLTVIPSLSEGAAGGSPASDFVIPANGGLVLDGPDVIVLSTADDYGEVNRAYNVSGTAGLSHGVNIAAQPQGLVIYGRLQVNDGYLSTRESGGLLYSSTASGQIEINGGIVDAKQIREYGTTGAGTSYVQNNGLVVLRGRFIRPVAYASMNDLVSVSGALTTRGANGTSGTFGTFSINNATNVFIMTGGIVRIMDVCGTVAPIYAAEIRSSAANTNITGGIFEISPTHAAAGDASPQLIHSTAPFGNLTINRALDCASDIQLNTYPLTVLGNLTLTSGNLIAANLDVSVSGNLTISSGTTYNSGTNTTRFAGTGNQIFTVSGLIDNGSAGLNNISVNKSTGIMSMAGTSANLTVQGSFNIVAGTFDDNGKTIYVAGNLSNSGMHISSPGTGMIRLNGTTIQSIGGNGNGVFNNLALDNNNAASAPVSLTANISVNGNLEFMRDKLFNIGVYNLRLNANANIISGDATSYIQTGGNSGDGGVTKVYSASSPFFLFPVGAPTLIPARAVKYTPATLTINGAPTAYGSVTIIPVGYEHPAALIPGVSLSYFWRIRSQGFTMGPATVTHGYVYGEPDMTGITQSECIAARYNAPLYTWTTGTLNDVDETNNVIGEPGSGSFLENVTFIDGDYTAGDNTPANPFGTPLIFYSRINGAASGNGLWSTANNWSFTSHTGPANTGGVVPGINDIVVIGGNDSIYLDRDRTNPWTTDNVDPRSCSSLQIERGSALDMGYNTNCAFGMVLSHPNGNGNFRITTSSASGTTFTFPAGDFTDYNRNLGTTELYTTNPAAGTTYWLPNNISSYGNLILSPLGGSNIIFGNTDLNIYGNLIARGQNSESWYCPTWNSNYPTPPAARAAKTITINGYFHLQGGALIFYGNNALAQNFIIGGDLIVNSNSGIMVYGAATNQSIRIGGSLINNAAFGTGVNLYRGCDFSLIPLTFFGDTDASISNFSGNPNTTLENVTINKGNSQISLLTIDIGGTLTTPVNNWLNLQNGTLRYMRQDPAEDFTISTNTAFAIPASSGLYVDYTNTNNTEVLISNTTTTDASDLLLSGKLTVVNGDVYVGPTNGTTNRNNDIEYSGGGFSEIEVQNGNLIVNGQIRRNPAISSGILKYTQSGGSVVINGFPGGTPNPANAKFEILNAGSSFTMSNNASLTVVRGGGTTHGDLFLRPGTSSVAGTSTIYLGTANTGSAQSFKIDANIELNNLTINGQGFTNTVNLMVNPLILKGTLLLSNSLSILRTNNIDVTIKGNLTNNGTSACYDFGTNHTFMAGDVQSVSGTSATNFYDLTIDPVTSVTLSHNTTISNNLVLEGGSMICGAYAVYVGKNVINNATYTDTQYGIILNGTAGRQEISGTGTYGRLELNNADGATVKNAVTLQKDLVLTSGIFDINRYMLTLGQNSNILGTGFGLSKMITTDGVFSNVGITKVFAPGAATFTYPIGVAGKYTPAVLTINANATTGSIRVNNINSPHPAVFDPDNVLQYFWEVESSAITGFEGNVVLNYKDTDVKGGPESDYVEARLIVPGTSWTKGATGADNVDELNNDITFYFTAGTSNLSGEYTAGIDPAIPDNVPVFTSNSDGLWNNPSIWTQTAGDPYTLTGGPNGFIVIIDNEVSVDANYCQAYRTTINDELRIVSPYFGHNLGTVDGSGKLYLESGSFPAGRFNDFLDCAGNSTLEYGGSGSYNIIADLYSSIPNIMFTGTGTRILPDKDLIICNILDINGPGLDNSLYNRKLTIQGIMQLTAGSFNSGTGADATVSLAGITAQSLEGFTGSNSLNNLEINNNAGLTLSGPIEVKRNLLLTNGIINTSSVNMLTVTNTLINSIIPAGGSSNSYINGPFTKRLNQGDTYFKFPVGNTTTNGNKFSIRATETGTHDWTVEYVNPSSRNTYVAPLTAVNEEEYWNISTAGGGRAYVNIEWDPASDLTPLMTQFGLSDMRVAEYNGTDWTELSTVSAGDSYNGSSETTIKVTIPVGSAQSYTLACINTPKPRIRFSPGGPICGTAGIPVTMSTSYTIFAPFTINYSIDGVPQAPLSPATFPATIPTLSAGGVYLITGFTYNYPAGNLQTGVVDITPVTTYTVPTTADAGENQSICGGTNATLEGNTPVTGTGLWTITSGTGGTVQTPTVPTSLFNGTNGTTYTLRWTISNGTCTSTDDVVISFPLLATQPENFTSSSADVCQGENGVPYIVPNDPSVSYIWSYSGSGYTFHGTGNSVTVDFDGASTSGTLSVVATNTCGNSLPRSIGVNVHPVPTISLDPASTEICQGIAAALLSYSATTQSPDRYSISYSAAAIAEGFINVNNSPLSASPVTLVIPVAAATDDYAGDIIVNNTVTGCMSSPYSFTVTIHELPVPAITGTDTTCSGASESFTTEAGMTNYTWSITPGSGSIVPPGDTFEAIVTWGGVTGQYEDRVVSVSYTNSNGCTSAAATQKTIRVFRLPETGPTYHIPNLNQY